MNEFERGQDPKKSLNIGIETKLKRMLDDYIGYHDWTWPEALHGALRQILTEDSKDSSLVKYILKQNPRVGMVPTRSLQYKADNHLVDALYTRNIEVIKLIAERAEDINVTMNHMNNQSGLQWAVEESRWEQSKYHKIINLLLDLEADPDYYNGGPLLEAIKVNNHHLVKKLLWKNASISTKGGRIARYINHSEDWENRDRRIHHAIKMREQNKYPDGSQIPYYPH